MSSHEKLGMKIGEAAKALEVSTNTLRSWESRHGFPQAKRTAGGHRRYDVSEIESLASFYSEDVSISAAIGMAIAKLRESENVGLDEESALTNALKAYDKESANKAMEQSLAIRSIERAVNETLLESVNAVGEEGGSQSAARSFAGRWADGWMNRAGQLFSEPYRGAILIGDANNGEINEESLDTSALELFSRGLGFNAIRLAVEHHEGISDAVREIDPADIVLAGSSSDRGDVDRWMGDVNENTDHSVGFTYRSDLTVPGSVALPEDAFSASRVLYDSI